MVMHLGHLPLLVNVQLLEQPEKTDCAMCSVFRTVMPSTSIIGARQNGQLARGTYISFGVIADVSKVCRSPETINSSGI
jgi:hypothetical protein